MIPCSPGLEPAQFDARARQRGRQWLAANPKPAATPSGKRCLCGTLLTKWTNLWRVAGRGGKEGGDPGDWRASR